MVSMIPGRFQRNGLMFSMMAKAISAEHRVSTRVDIMHHIDRVS